MKFEYRKLTLELVDTFTIARETQEAAHNLMVSVEYTDGNTSYTGLGECAPHAFIGSSMEVCLRTAEAIAAEDNLLQVEPFDLGLIEKKLIQFAPDCPSVRSAVMCAVLDIYGQVLGQPLWKIGGLDPTTMPPTSFTIGISDLDHMIKKALSAAEKGYSILKIKLGASNDVEVCRGIIEATGLKLRVDANCGWTPEEAIEIGGELQALGVEFIEQPIPPGDNDAFARITEALEIPIIADESCKNAEDAAALAGCVTGVNIKLTKCGGPLEAMRIIHTARAHGMQIMLGCQVESSLGITSAAHLAPLVDYVDLDGHLLLAEDPYRGVTNKGSILTLPSGPGLGVTEA